MARDPGNFGSFLAYQSMASPLAVLAQNHSSVASVTPKPAEDEGSVVVAVVAAAAAAVECVCTRTGESVASAATSDSVVGRHSLFAA